MSDRVSSRESGGGTSSAGASDDTTCICVARSHPPSVAEKWRVSRRLRPGGTKRRSDKCAAAPIFRRRPGGPEMHILAHNDYQGGLRGGWQTRPPFHRASVGGTITCASEKQFAARTDLANSLPARGTGPKWHEAQGSA